MLPVSCGSRGRHRDLLAVGWINASRQLRVSELSHLIESVSLTARRVAQGSSHRLEQRRATGFFKAALMPSVPAGGTAGCRTSSLLAAQARVVHQRELLQVQPVVRRLPAGRGSTMSRPHTLRPRSAARDYDRCRCGFVLSSPFFSPLVAPRLRLNQFVRRLPCLRPNRLQACG